MDWRTVVVLAALTCLVSIAMLRVELKQRRRVLLVLPLPALFLLWRWSLYRDVWLEPLLGVGLGLMAAAVWWMRRGRRLPAPTSDNIRVWTKDQPFDD